MKLRKSFFNGAVLCKDFTRYLAAWLGYTVVVLILTLSDMEPSMNGALDSLKNDLSWMPLLNAAFALVAVECLFGDLYDRRMCNAIHALPIRRQVWFRTHILAAFLSWLVPNLIRVAIILPLLGEHWAAALVWLGIMAVQYLFFLSLGAVCAMCTGTRVGLAAMYAVVNLAALLLYWFASTFYEPFLIGIQLDSTPIFPFCPWAYLSTGKFMVIKTLFVFDDAYIYLPVSEPGYKGLGEDFWYIIVLGVLAVALLLLAKELYRRRKLECTGNFVIFRPLRPVIWILMTLTGGALFLGLGLVIDATFISLMLGLLVSGILTELLVTRSAKSFPKGMLKAAATAAVVGLTIIITAADPLGITRWVPEADEVESVRVDKDLLIDSTSIQRVIEAHQLLIEESHVDDSIWFGGRKSGYPGNPEVKITYRLKNGKTVIRRYEYTQESAADHALEQLRYTPEEVLHYTDWDSYLKKPGEVTVECGGITYTLNTRQRQELLTAVREDCREGNWGRNPNANFMANIWLTPYYHIKVDPICRHTASWIRLNIPV